ncbi:uncharacterized protein LOC132755903 [Ruditapes philippinarum]|uniref:uncharacterized protein LOC132755903 n=1 Tax=Ruditapes philippinarum TaxID=129788 RepID=UPI00295BEF68|nr:uncharacterized protein LOC132755903 [Ruditapes philippinarum]
MRKLEVIAVFVLGAFLSTNCTHFKVKSKLTGGACILMNIDATFQLTYKSQVANLFDLKGASVIGASSKCGNVFLGSTSVLSVKLFPSEEMLMFRFTIQNNNVNVSMRFMLDAKKHFQDMNSTLPVQLNDTHHLPIGTDSPNSYKCISEETVAFNSTNNFHLTMMITNLQVQAYDIINSVFGPVTPVPSGLATVAHTTTRWCIAIRISHVPQLTLSTHHRTNSTTDSYTLLTAHTLERDIPAPETTTKPISTSSKPKSTTESPRDHKYVVRDNKEVCIVLQGNITFEISYQEKDGGATKALVAVPDDANVNGNCSYTATSQEITLAFFNSTWMLNIVVVKGGISNEQNAKLIKVLSDTADYSWQYASVTYQVDDHFPGAKNAGDIITATAEDTVGKFAAGVDGSYKCNAKQDLEFEKNKNMKMDLSKMQYRAFGKTNSTDFSGAGVSKCPADDHNGGGGSGQKTLRISIACAFAGLVFIVFVACGISRYRKRKRGNGHYKSGEKGLVRIMDG